MDLPNRLFVLFRGAEVPCPDEFVDTLQNADLKAVTVPPLHFEFVNIEQFVQNLRQFHSFYSAMIITSPRVLELIRKVLKDEKGSGSSISSLLPLIPILPIGPKSFQIASELGFRPLFPIPIDQVNNAAQLAQVIIDTVKQDLNLAIALKSRPIWMPTSDIGREQLAQLLQPVKILVNKFVCYRTVASDRLNSELRRILLQTRVFKETLSQEIKERSSPTPSVECISTKTDVYFVMFSPSGVDSVLNQVTCVSLDNIKWMAIGPTTEQHLKQFDLRVSKTALRPTPEGLLAAIGQL